MFRNHNASDVLRLSLKANPDLKLSRNFRLAELACKDGTDTVLVHPALILALQAIRDVAGAGIRINSGYRTPEYNAKLEKSAKNSLHVLGMAADIVVTGMTPMQVAAIANDLKLGGIKAYSTFTHIDVGRPRTW
jgi:uncharacterized protein YcbK (DUF882 family)